MQCPQCGGDAVDKLWEAKIKLDRCRRCGGI